MFCQGFLSYNMKHNLVFIFVFVHNYMYIFPHLREDGGVSGWFSSGGPRVWFLTRYDGEVSKPIVGREGSRVSMRVAGRSASLLSSHGRGTWPRDVLKKVSRGLSRVEAGIPGFPRLVQLTSESRTQLKRLSSSSSSRARLIFSLDLLFLGGCYMSSSSDSTILLAV